MRRLGTALARLQSRWTLGATVLFCLAVAVAAFGFAAGVVLVALGGLLGWEDSQTIFWWMVSAVFWLPLAAATLGPLFEEIARRKVDEAIERARSAGAGHLQWGSNVVLPASPQFRNSRP